MNADEIQTDCWYTDYHGRRLYVANIYQGPYGQRAEIHWHGTEQYGNVPLHTLAAELVARCDTPEPTE